MLLASPLAAQISVTGDGDVVMEGLCERYVNRDGIAKLMIKADGVIACS